MKRPTTSAWLVRAFGAAIAATFLVILASPSAWADSASDSRATATLSGNATTCSDLGFGADTMIGSSTGGNASDSNVSGTVKPNAGPTQTGKGEELDIGIIGPNSANIAVDAVMVKGGNGYNTYTTTTYMPPTPQPDQHYIAPYNNGGNIPTISHWLVCYRIQPGAAAPEVPLAITLPIAGSVVFGSFWFVRRRGPRASRIAS